MTGDLQVEYSTDNFFKETFLIDKNSIRAELFFSQESSVASSVHLANLSVYTKDQMEEKNPKQEENLEEKMNPYVSFGSQRSRWCC